MSFMGRLDQASAEAKADVRRVDSKKAAAESKLLDDEATMAAPKETRSLRPTYSAEDKAKDTAECEAAERGSSILNDVSEYLFDLFDANCMDEFRRLEELDSRATVAFEGSEDGDEFTLAQSAIHSEFTALFESLVEAFLSAKGWGLGDFYEAAKAAQGWGRTFHALAEGLATETSSGVGSRPEGSGQSPLRTLLLSRSLSAKASAAAGAAEVLEVVAEVSDFNHWAARVRRQAAERAVARQRLANID